MDEVTNEFPPWMNSNEIMTGLTGANVASACIPLVNNQWNTIKSLLKSSNASGMLQGQLRISFESDSLDVPRWCHLDLQSTPKTGMIQHKRQNWVGDDSCWRDHRSPGCLLVWGGGWGGGGWGRNYVPFSAFAWTFFCSYFYVTLARCLIILHATRHATLARCLIILHATRHATLARCLIILHATRHATLARCRIILHTTRHATLARCRIILHATRHATLARCFILALSLDDCWQTSGHQMLSSGVTPAKRVLPLSLRSWPQAFQESWNTSHWQKVEGIERLFAKQLPPKDQWPTWQPGQPSDEKACLSVLLAQFAAIAQPSTVLKTPGKVAMQKKM